MCYGQAFLDSAWSGYLAENDTAEEAGDPDAFVRWTYARAMAHRQPLYRAIANAHGVTVAAGDVAKVASEGDLIDLIAHTLEAQSPSA